MRFRDVSELLFRYSIFSPFDVIISGSKPFGRIRDEREIVVHIVQPVVHIIHRGVPVVFVSVALLWRRRQEWILVVFGKLSFHDVLVVLERDVRKHTRDVSSFFHFEICVSRHLPRHRVQFRVDFVALFFLVLPFLATRRSVQNNIHSLVLFADATGDSFHPGQNAFRSPQVMMSLREEFAREFIARVVGSGRFFKVTRALDNFEPFHVSRLQIELFD